MMSKLSAHWQALPQWVRIILAFGVAPALLYFTFFGVYTYPWIAHFSDSFFIDAGDGLQNVWNIWWVQKAVVQLHESPWWTQYLHAPYGVSLLGQTLNPINGFLGIGLQTVFSLVQTLNLIVVFSFVSTGVFTLWLCYHISKSYWASLVGGFIFTFSTYHFAHAAGHLQLVTTEFVPLFLLLWLRLLERPRVGRAVVAGLALFLVVLSDYYYFFYSMIMAAVLFAYYLWTQRMALRSRQLWVGLGIFGVTALVTVGPLVLSLMRLNRIDPLLGAHPADLLGMDLAAPFLYGATSRLSGLTQGYWSHLVGFPAETSVSLGFGVLILLLLGIWWRKRLPTVMVWLGMAVGFGIMSLGPHLHVWGRVHYHIGLPYQLAVKVFPPLELSGVPVRMMMPVVLCSAIVASLVLAGINWRRYWLPITLLLLLIGVEAWPSGLPLTAAGEPSYVKFLQNQKSSAAVLDNAAVSDSYALYHQTEYQKPMVLGYISRTPTSVSDKDQVLIYQITTNHLGGLCKNYDLRYITTPPQRPLKITFPVIYRGSDALIYDLRTGNDC